MVHEPLGIERKPVVVRKPLVTEGTSAGPSRQTSSAWTEGLEEGQSKTEEKSAAAHKPLGTEGTSAAVHDHSRFLRTL